MIDVSSVHRPSPSTAGSEIGASDSLTLSVVSHGHASLLRRLLDQLDDEVALVGMRVVVTLNVPTEPFDVARYRRIQPIVIRNTRPRGFGSNHNAAFMHCSTRWFGVINPDLSLAGEEPFSATVRTAERIPRIGAVAPRVIAADGALEDSVRTNLTPWSLLKRRILRRAPAIEPTAVARLGTPFYWLAGMCMLIDADAFRAVGGFDERFFLYCEDYDLCARLYNAGYSIAVEPSVRIVHEARRDSHRSSRHLRWHLSSLLKVWCSRAFWQVTYRQTRCT